MPSLNRLENIHFLDIVKYTPQWNCQAPKYPDNNMLENELGDISSQVHELEDGTDAGNSIDKLNLNIDQSFYEYHEEVEAKMEALWECIRRTILVGEASKLQELSRDELEDLVEKMIDELSQECPEVMYMYQHRGKVYHQFADLLKAWGLYDVAFFPDMNGSTSFIHNNYADKNTTVHWYGNRVVFRHAEHIMQVEETGIRFSNDPRVSGQVVTFDTLVGYFKDWKEPQPEEVELFKMIYPHVDYNVDIIRSACSKV